MRGSAVRPIDYLAVEIPREGVRTEVLAAVLELAQRRLIRVLDLRAFTVCQDGRVETLDLGDLDELRALGQTRVGGPGLLSDEDVEEVATLIGTGSAAVLLLYENAWSGPFAAAMKRAGADLIASFRVPADQAASLLDLLEAGPAVVGGLP